MTDAAGKTYGDADAASLTTGAGSGFVEADGVTATYTRQAGENAGSYAITATLSSSRLTAAQLAANYSIINTGAVYTIGRRAASVSADALTKVYGDADPVLTGTLSGFLPGDGVAAAYTRAAGESVAGGPYAVTATLNPSAALANYDVTYTAGSLTVTPRVLTVTATASDKVYDGTTAASATLTLGNTVAGEVPTATFTSAVFGDKNAGTGKTVTVSGVALDPAFAANYTLSGVTTASAVASITAKAISGTFTAADKVYDGTRAATVLTRNLGGVIGQDAVALTGGTAAFADKNAGANKSVSLTGATLTGADAANYTLTGVADAAASIAQRALTVGATASDKVYDGGTAASATLTLGNAVAGEAPAATFTSAVFADKNAGVGKAVTVSGIALDPASASNYTLNGVTTASAVANITAKAISGAFTAADKVYDGTRAANVLTRNLGGVIGQDAVTLTGGTAAFADKNAGANKSVSLTGATLTGADAANYTLTGVADAAASIAQRALTVGATASDKVYDGGTAASATLTLGNAVAGEAPAATFTSAVFADKNAGVGKAVTVSGIALDPASAANYTLGGATTASAVANITAKAIGGAFTAADKVYDGGAVATVLSRSLGGVIGQDAVTLTGGIAAFADKNASAGKTVTLTGATLTGADAANYTLTGVADAAAAIDRRALTVSATASDKVYDGSTAASATLTLGNAVAGEAPAATFTSAAFGDKNAGTGKAVTVSGIDLDPASASNYTLNGVTTASAVANITAKAISGAFTAADKVYDGGAAATVLTRTLGGVIGQDAVTLTGGTAAFADKNAGANKSVSLTGAALTGADAANYTLTGVGATTAGVARRALTITATGTNKVFDGTTAAAVTLADNRVVGDQLASGYTSAAFADPNVGTGKSVTVTGISVTGADAGNYTFNTSATTTASITPAAVTIGLATDRPVAVPGLAVTFTATVAAANGAPVTGTVTFKDGSTVLGTAPVVNGKAVLTTDAFQYGNKTITATFAGGGNYAVPTATASVGVSVVPAAILPDPVTGQNALFVGGTAGDDEIEVLGMSNNRYAVEVGSGCWKLFDQTLTGVVARVVMYGGAGNDAIVANGNVRVPVFAFGGAGNDILVGAENAPNVLVGGAGNDLLYAGCARDILIGGAGSDLLFGRAGDDMLIGGSTAFDANESALWGLQAEWNSSRDLGTRVANLRGTGTGPRANGNAFLVAGGPAATVFNDGAGDFLYGSSGRDWYFANTTGGGVLDVIAGLRGDDLLTEL